MMKLRQRLNAASARLRSTLDGLSKAVVGRGDVTRQLLYALVTKQHLLLEGPPGVAKSYMARLLFGAIGGANVFHVQCTRKMSEDYIVGPLDMRKFREQGIYEHRVEGSLVTCDMAFVDEFLDLAPNTLRALLEVLNERSFTRGVQKVKSSLWTAIACTNFSGDSEASLDAVMDRFMFKAKVTPLASAKERKAMLLGSPTEIPEVRFSDIRLLNKHMKTVKIPEVVLDTYLAMCDKLSLTDRFFKNALDVVRANAVLHGRLVAKIEDLASLDTAVVRVGDTTTAGVWASAYSTHYKTALANEQRYADMMLLAVRSHGLLVLAEDSDTYSKIHPIAVETRELLGAAESLSIVQTESIKTRIRARCDAIFTKARTLFSEE